MNKAKYRNRWLTDIRFEDVLTKKESKHYAVSLALGFIGMIPFMFACISMVISLNLVVALVFWSFALVTLGTGVTFIIITHRKIKKRTDILIENEILQRATAERGKLIQADIYVLPFPKSQCEKVIEKLTRLDLCEIQQFTATGDIYFFPHITSHQEKMEAKGVTEF
ncbi:hypothetical protein GGQ92_001822 [Gracilibacillus halotolerans]|uniref:Uncharacterized protein n=1 Tax=Gracilibacillus halotolerans TaxID=74386 RepID=A0A841RM82_9BACI|nr:hypothetical protein [Gracilibacillus halotolerans]MBB6513032.1 hypothetical protein [Gracilibacillus halotolerans]